ncbi:thioesterase family protein [Lachnospiraceae bacterium 42-17]|jgi:acyl-CoA thioester hydrolase|nr:acyl-CoA thioesterase [Dorea sp.]
MSEFRKYTHKVQYYETDQMGIVHHSNYIRWFEEARTDFMEQMGLGYEQMEEKGILSPVLSVEADYLRMVHFGETVTIEAFIKEYNGIKLTVGYEIFSDRTEMVHCRGTSKHCFINREGRPLSLKQACIEFHDVFNKGLEDHKKKK